MTLTRMHDQLRAFNDKKLGKGAAEAEILDTERELGVTFPESYKSFLLQVGWARFGTQIIFGLGEDIPEHYELIRNTKMEREEAHLKPYLIPVMNDGAGGNYCLNIEAMRDTECPIVFDSVDANGVHTSEKVAKSFAQWLLDILAVL